MASVVNWILGQWSPSKKIKKKKLTDQEQLDVCATKGGGAAAAKIWSNSQLLRRKIILRHFIETALRTAAILCTNIKSPCALLDFHQKPKIQKCPGIVDLSCGAQIAYYIDHVVVIWTLQCTGVGPSEIFGQKWKNQPERLAELTKRLPNNCQFIPSVKEVCRGVF